MKLSKLDKLVLWMWTGGALLLMAMFAQDAPAAECLKKPKHGTHITPIQTCVLSRPVILKAADEAIEPISVTAIKYVLIHTTINVCEGIPGIGANPPSNPVIISGGGWPTPRREPGSECEYDVRSKEPCR